jgi:hypothetical protein
MDISQVSDAGWERLAQFIFEQSYIAWEGWDWHDLNTEDQARYVHLAKDFAGQLTEALRSPPAEAPATH